MRRLLQAFPQQRLRCLIARPRSFTSLAARAQTCAAGFGLSCRILVTHSSYDEVVRFAVILLGGLLPLYGQTQLGQAIPDPQPVTAANESPAIETPQEVLQFESGGMRYKAVTRNGVTVMFAPLPAQVLDYAILQVAISNGSGVSWAVRPEDCRFEKKTGQSVQAQPARDVVSKLIDKAGRGDVIKLIAAYEASLYNNARIHSTNGYETRRQNAFAELGASRLKAAAAASAIALVTTKLAAGQSTDGAVFFPNQGKPLGPGRLIVTTAGETFIFPAE